MTDKLTLEKASQIKLEKTSHKLALFVWLAAVQIFFSAFLLMIVLGNLHVIAVVIPAIGFWKAMSISLFAVPLLRIATNIRSKTTGIK